MRCPECGFKLPDHKLSCHGLPRQLSDRGEGIQSPYKPPRFVNGFLQLDLRDIYVAYTREDLAKLLRGAL